MKIALLAPFEERVPPRKYGGIERVIYDLAWELHRMGHEVTTFASGDSQLPGRLIPIVPKAIGSGKPKRIREALTYKGLTKVMGVLAKEHFDVLHNHIGWQPLVFREMFHIPVITTIHWVLDNTCEKYMYNLFSDMAFVSISNSQRKPLPNMNYAATVYHGLDLKRFQFRKEPGGYLAFLGRFSPVKGPVQAIEIAKKTGQKLVMAAKINEFERDYYEQQIKPHIDGDQIVYLGEVDDAEKAEMLGGASALLSPLQWDEPFGLTNIEAMACGTPVIALKSGSLPEIIQHGKTGFLCDTVDQMAARVAELGTLDRAACRKYVEANFTARRMAEDYVKLYTELAPAHQKKSTKLKDLIPEPATNLELRQLRLATSLDENIA